MGSKYLLVKFSRDYADEFDVKSVNVINSTRFKEYCSVINEAIKLDNFSIYFGTNEAIEFSSNESIEDSCKIEELSLSQYLMFSKLLGEFGTLTLSEIYEAAKYHINENNKTEINLKETYSIGPMPALINIVKKDNKVFFNLKINDATIPLINEDTDKIYTLPYDWPTIWHDGEFSDILSSGFGIANIYFVDEIARKKLIASIHCAVYGIDSVTKHRVLEDVVNITCLAQVN